MKTAEYAWGSAQKKVELATKTWKLPESSDFYLSFPRYIFIGRYLSVQYIIEKFNEKKTSISFVEKSKFIRYATH